MPGLADVGCGVGVVADVAVFVGVGESGCSMGRAVGGSEVGAGVVGVFVGLGLEGYADFQGAGVDVFVGSELGCPALWYDLARRSECAWVPASHHCRATVGRSQSLEGSCL